MRRLLLAVILLATPLLAQRVANADESRVWQTTNAGGGGALNSPAIDPASGAWAIGSDLSGAYLSHDQGASWTAIGSSNGLFDTHVSALTFALDSRLILGTEAGIYVASASGSEATRVADTGYVSALTTSTDGQVAYAVSQGAWDGLEPTLWRSVDGGWNWEPVPGSLPAGARVTALRVHPTDPTAVIVVIAEGRWPENLDIANQALLSEDGGGSFRPIAEDAGEVYDIRYDLTSPNRLWLTTGAGAEGQLLRSEDAGWTWAVVGVGRSGAIWLDPTSPDRIRLVEVTGHFADDPAGGVWESLDAGATFSLSSPIAAWDAHWPGWEWSYAESFQGLLQTIGFSPTDPNLALWATTQWAFASTDGESFRSAMGVRVGGGFRSSGLDNIVPYGIAPSPADPQRVYSYNWDVGCQRSDDGGGSWVPCNQTWTGGVRTSAWEADNGGDLMSLAPDPTKPDLVWATMNSDRTATTTRLVRSDASGSSGSWVLSDGGLPPTNYLGGLSVDPSSPAGQRRILVISDGTVYRSVDDGWSWQWVFDCPLAGTAGCQATWLDGSGTVFAGGGAGLFRSASDGDPGTWVPVGDGLLAGDPWIIAPWDDAFAGVSDLAIDPRDPWSIWVAKFTDGLYHSSDGGDTFAKVRDDWFIRTVTVTPSGAIWTGSSSATFHGSWHPDSAGALASSDGGATWQSMNDGLSWPFVVDLVVGTDGTLWAAHAGLGAACLACRS